MTDHDQRFKALLKELFADFFARFFPEWAGRFDFAAIEWLPPQGARRPTTGFRWFTSRSTRRIPSPNSGRGCSTTTSRCAATGFPSAMELPINDWQKFLLCECVDAYLPLEAPQLEDYDRLLRTEPFREIEAMGVTFFGQGRIEGRRETIADQLEARFGPLSLQAAERLRNWPADKLGELGRALLTAGSLKELGLED